MKPGPMGRGSIRGEGGGSMDLYGIQSYIADRYISELATAGMIEHINEVYLDLTRIFTADIIATEELETDAPLTQLTWKARQIRNIYLGNRRLKQVAKEALLRDTQGIPKYWAAYGSGQGAAGGNYLRFILAPGPHELCFLDIDYEPLPEELSADSDVPKYIPEEYHYLIAWGVIALLTSLPGTEDWNVAQAWEARFRAGVNEMLQVLGLTAPDNYPSIAAAVEREASKNV